MSDTTTRPATPKQLAYLKALARRTGQTFTWPRTSAAAGREIARLKAVPASTRTERALERRDNRSMIEAVKDAAAVAGHEVAGYGSSCTWGQRS